MRKMSIQTFLLVSTVLISHPSFGMHNELHQKEEEISTLSLMPFQKEDPFFETQLQTTLEDAPDHVQFLFEMVLQEKSFLKEEDQLVRRKAYFQHWIDKNFKEKRSNDQSPLHQFKEICAILSPFQRQKVCNFLI